MKYFVVLFVVMVAQATAQAEDYYHVRKDGQRDYNRPVTRVDGNQVYQLRKDGQRDYTKSSMRTENGQTYHVRKDGQRDWSRSSVRR